MELDLFKRALDTAYPTKTPQQEEQLAKLDVEAQKAKYRQELNSAPFKLETPKDFASGSELALQSEGLKASEENFNVDELYSQNRQGEYVAKFDTYTPGRDNYAFFAENQSRWDKWGSGAKQFTGTVLSAVAGLSNLGYGFYAMAKEGKTSSFYDNDLMNSLDDWTESIRLENPIFKTYEEQKMGFGESMTTASFWADDFLQGTAFTAGAVASEIVFRTLTRGAFGGAWFARKGLQTTAQVAKETAKMRGAFVKPVTQAMSKVLPKLDVQDWNTISKGLNITRAAITSAGYEAGFEARAFIREQRETFDKDFFDKNGREATEEERGAFENQLLTNANALFGFNMAVVGASNVAQFGALFKIKAPKVSADNWFNRKIFGVGIQDGAKVATSKAQLANRIVYTLGRNAFLEGAVEEGLQAVGSRTAEGMLKRSYDPINANLTESIFNQTYDEFKEAFGETYGTEEGRKEVYLGMLIGALTGSATNMWQNKSLIAPEDSSFRQLDRRADDIEKQLLSKSSNYSANVIAQNMLNSNRVVASERAIENADRKGDLLGGQQERASLLFSQLMRASKLDYVQETKEQTLAQIDLITPEQIVEQYGISLEQAEEVKQGMKEEYTKAIENYENYWDTAKALVADSISGVEYQEVIKSLEKRGYTQGMAEAEVADVLQSAFAYEMFMGNIAHDHSEEMLQAFQNEVQNLNGDSQVEKAMTITDVLQKSDKISRDNFAKKQEELRNTKEELAQTIAEYKRVETTVASMTGENTNRASTLARLNELMNKQEELQEAVRQLASDARTLLNSAKLQDPLSRNKDVNSLSEDDILNFNKTMEKVVKDIQGMPRQKADRLTKLLSEYQKSVVAYKRYQDRVNTLSDKNSGLKGKKGVLPSLFAGKTVTRQTAELIEGLLNTHFEMQDAQAKKIEEKVTTNEVTPKEVKMLLKNQPYLFSQYQRDLEEGDMPTPQEIDRFVELLEKDTVTDEEIDEQERLNEKLSNWYLVETTPLAQMIEQSILMKTPVQEELDEEVTDTDFDKMIQKDDADPRKFEFLQVTSHVYILKNPDKNAYYFSHLSAKKFLEMIGQQDSFKVMRGKKFVDVKAEDIKIGDEVFFGNKSSFLITTRGSIKLSATKEEYESMGFKTRPTASGYSFLYGEDGKPMKSDFAGIDRYSYDELMNLKNGSKLIAKVDMDDAYNKGLSEEDFERNVKIEFFDEDGNRTGAVLKGIDQDETTDQEGFLLLRKLAKENAEARTGIVELGSVTVETIFIGAPVVELENGQEKQFSIDKALIEDEGTWSGTKLTTKNDTKDVRIDLLEDIKRKVPVVIVKKGNTLIAYPVKGGKVRSEMAETFTETNAELAIKINKTLIENKRKPEPIYYNSPEENNMYDPETGLPTPLLKQALEKVNSIPKDEFAIENTTINIDLNGQKFLPPKISIRVQNGSDVDSYKPIDNDVEIVSTSKPPAPTQNKGRKGLNGVEEIEFTNPTTTLEGFNIDGNYWNVITSTNRAKVLVNIGGVTVPFYLTTGQAGKGLIPGWYPFFGVGNDGWLNKTDKSDMESYYERYWGTEVANKIKEVSQELNSFYGVDPSVFSNDGDPNATTRPLSTLADKVEDYINSKLPFTPAINDANARKTLRANVEQLGKLLLPTKPQSKPKPQVTKPTVGQVQKSAPKKPLKKGDTVKTTNTKTVDTYTVENVDGNKVTTKNVNTGKKKTFKQEELKQANENEEIQLQQQVQTQNEDGRKNENQSSSKEQEVLTTPKTQTDALLEEPQTSGNEKKGKQTSPELRPQESQNQVEEVILKPLETYLGEIRLKLDKEVVKYLDSSRGWTEDKKNKDYYTWLYNLAMNQGGVLENYDYKTFKEVFNSEFPEEHRQKESEEEKAKKC